MGLPRVKMSDGTSTGGALRFASVSQLGFSQPTVFPCYASHLFPRGCLEERAGTRHDSQLASFSRGSNCSSGNALPLAENAILGVCAIEQFRVHAAGSSQESSTCASRAGGLRGVVGSGLTGFRVHAAV
jgi:hypothetical protein